MCSVMCFGRVADAPGVFVVVSKQKKKARGFLEWCLFVAVCKFVCLMGKKDDT